MDMVLLTVQEEMWAKMLLEVLEDNHVPAVSMPVFGVGMATRGGAAERLRVYVPQNWLPRAQELLDALFSGAGAEEGWEWSEK